MSDDKAAEYCARVAWDIFCSKNDHPSCKQPKGKRWGPPYSGPLAR
jgi:hypothetical protein